jgi:ferric-dicitrate binding protein FerR (iron transport regulator)
MMMTTMDAENDQSLDLFIKGDGYAGAEEAARENRHDVPAGDRRLVDALAGLRGQRAGFSSRLDREEAFRRVAAAARRRRQRRLSRRLAVVASLLLLAGAGGWWHASTTGTPAPPVPREGIRLVAGRPEAELILPGGRRVLLDDKRDSIRLAGSDVSLSNRDHTLVYAGGGDGRAAAREHTVKVSRGAEYKLVLADGTRVFLNAATTLRYPDRFTGDAREVFVEGEAYFEVTPDAGRPFTVHAGEMDIRVTGTSFNVNARAGKGKLVATLVEGKILAVFRGAETEVAPGQQVTCDRESGAVERASVDTRLHVAWKEGYYRFENMPLGDLMDLFELWYDIEVSFEDRRSRELEFTGSLKRYDDISFLLKRIEYTKDVEFIIDGRRVLVKDKR